MADPVIQGILDLQGVKGEGILAQPQPEQGGGILGNWRYYAGPHLSNRIDALAELAGALTPTFGTDYGRDAAKEYEQGNYGRMAAQMAMGTMAAGLDAVPGGRVASEGAQQASRWAARALSERRIPEDLFLNPVFDGAIDKPYVYYSTNRPVPPQARDLGEIRDRALGSDRPLTMEEIALHELVAVNDEARGYLLKEMHDLKSGGKGRGYEFIRNPGKDWQGASISPSSQEPGKFQVSYFDKNGFSGDSQHDSLESALKRVASDGYMTPQPGALSAAMKKFTK